MTITACSPITTKGKIMAQTITMPPHLAAKLRRFGITIDARDGSLKAAATDRATAQGLTHERLDDLDRIGDLLKAAGMPMVERMAVKTELARLQRAAGLTV
jgi:hypothetical protein